MITPEQKLRKKIIQCKKCPRLVSYTREIARNKVKRFQSEKYWGKPLPGFGDINAELLIIGLAPAAHGGNRTGRMFTGDSSGDWVSKVLYQNKFATSSTSKDVNDNFTLINTFITAAVRCAPPKNKPTKEEFENCLPFIEEELLILKNTRVIVCLGKIAFETCRKLFKFNDNKFLHGKIINLDNLCIISSYHPSRQNTQTGRLKWEEWNKIFKTAQKILKTEPK